MKIRRLAVLACIVVTIASWAFAQSGAKSRTHVTISPDELKWGPPPPALPPGSEIAVLHGDPSKAGSDFVIRAKFPDGYTVPPHWHQTDENVLVLQGTIMLGMGDKLDLTNARELPAGSFALMPAGMRHFARAKGETILNIHGIGPFTVNYVNPADDPRNKK